VPRTMWDAMRSRRKLSKLPASFTEGGKLYPGHGEQSHSPSANLIVQTVGDRAGLNKVLLVPIDVEPQEPEEGAVRG
jgi:hypothetical protein